MASCNLTLSNLSASALAASSAALSARGGAGASAGGGTRGIFPGTSGSRGEREAYSPPDSQSLGTAAFTLTLGHFNFS